MSILTIEDLKSRSVRDPVTHCWHWQGAKAGDGDPRIWTVDHSRIEKRLMSGPRAVWNIAHGKLPEWKIAYRTCGKRDCVNPVHMRLANSLAEAGAYARKFGLRKGRGGKPSRETMLKGLAARGITPTSESVVRAVRAATGTNVDIAAEFQLHPTTVSRIRRSKTHKHLLEAA